MTAPAPTGRMVPGSDPSRLLDAAPGPALLASSSGAVLAANAAFLAATGLASPADVVGRPLAEVLHGAAPLWEEVVRTGRAKAVLRVTRADGSLAALEVTASAPRGGVPADGAILVIAADVTAPLRLERAATVLGTALDSGGAHGFFDRLATGLEETLGMEMVLVGRLEEGEPRHVRTLAVRADGEPAEPLRYALHGAPCERVVGLAPCVFPSRVAELFPEDLVLAERGFSSYVGVPLAASDGRPLGLLAALSRRPLHDGASAARALGLFAARAGAEIERGEAHLEGARREEESRRLVASVPVGLLRYRLEADGRLVLVGANPAAGNILGVDSSALVGLTIEEAFPALAATGIPDAYRRAARDGTPWRDEDVAYSDGRIEGAYLVEAFQTAPGEMAAAFLDITPRRRAEEALRRREARLERLNGILRTSTRVREVLAEAQETGEVVGRVCAALVEERSWVFAWVGLLDEAGTEVRLAGASGPCDPESFRIDLKSLHGGTGCGRTAFLRGTAVLVDPSSGENVCVDCPMQGFHPGRSALAMPLWRGDRALGVLVLYALERGVFDAEESRVVADVADALAAALDRLEAEAQREEARRDRAFRVDVSSAALRGEELPSLLAALARAVEARLPAAGVLVADWDDERGKLRSAAGRGALADAGPADGALAAETARILAPGAEAGSGGRAPGSPLLSGARVWSWPLRDGSRSLGALLVAWQGDPGPDARAAAGEAAGPLALALAKARLHETDRERLATLLALHDTGVDLGSSRDRDDLLRSIVERAQGLVHGTMAGLYLARGDGSLALVLASGAFSRYVGTVLAPGEGACGFVAATRKPILLDDYRTWPGRSPHFSTAGVGSVIGVPVLWRGEVLGSLFVDHEVPGRFVRADVETVRLFAEQAAVAIANARLIGDLKGAAEELAGAYDATLEGWVRALDLRDKETEGHTQRVVARTLDLARRAGIGEEALVHVRRGALLHDIGKVGIPDRILLKPGLLTEEEWAVMRLHPTYAREMLSGIPFLLPALDIPWAHHERWDGTGYPRGLRGEEIPLAARAFAVVDIWDALRCDRPYRKAVPAAGVRAYLESIAGSHLDPRLVALFLATDPD